MIHRTTNPGRLRNVAARGLGAALMLGALVAGAYSLRNAALTHLGLISGAPAVAFEIRLPQKAATIDFKREAQVELLTDLNQTLAQLDSQLAATGDGRAVLRGTVALRFKTSDRVVVLSLPGQAQRAFKLRLPPSPSPSDDFGPWHMVDRVSPAPAERSDNPRSGPDDSFAIRYRVL